MDMTKKATCEITGLDIAIIERLHDLLVEKHDYSLDHMTLVDARILTNKMYEAFKKEKI